VSLGLFAYVRLQPPVVIRVDREGEASVVAGDTVKVGSGFLTTVGPRRQIQPKARAPRHPMSKAEQWFGGFLNNYLTYTTGECRAQYADALNMMTLNFRTLTMNKFRDDDTLGKIRRTQSPRASRSFDRAGSGHAVGLPGVRRQGNPPADVTTDRTNGKMVTRYQMRLVYSGEPNYSPRAYSWASSGSNRWSVKRTSTLTRRAACSITATRCRSDHHDECELDPA